MGTPRDNAGRAVGPPGGTGIGKNASILKAGTYHLAGCVVVAVEGCGTDAPVVNVHKSGTRIERADVACPCGRTSTIVFEYEDAL
jgi:hypothetical protein